MGDTAIRTTPTLITQAWQAWQAQSQSQSQPQSQSQSESQAQAHDPSHDPNRAHDPIHSPLPSLPPIRSLVCGWRHTMLLDAHGDVYICGHNRYGVCCAHEDVKYVTWPKRVTWRWGEEEQKQKHMDNNNSHASQQSDVNININNDTDINSNNAHNHMIRPPYIIAIANGWHHVMVLTSVGTVYAWGRGSYGQLACDINISHEPCYVAFDEHITRIACGAESGYALTTQGHVYAWGWNEHGNLGLGHQQNVKQPTRVVLPHDDSTQQATSIVAAGAVIFVGSQTRKPH